MTVHGKNLAGSGAVQLAIPDSSFFVAPAGPATAAALPLEIVAKPEAVPGPRTLVIQTPDGVVTATVLVTTPPIRLAKLVPAGVNVWWETPREPDFDKVVACLAPRGRMILMAGRDARPPFPVGPFYVKGCSVHGFVMFMAHPDEQRDAADDINDWLAAGKIRPRIDRVLPLSDAATAHELQEQNTIAKTATVAGKIVLKV